MNIKNLIIQYGQCKNKCPYCYLTKQNIVKNNKKFWETLSYLISQNIENLYLSYQGSSYIEVYKRIFLNFINKLNKINIKDMMITIHSNDITPSFLHFYNKINHENANINIKVMTSIQNFGSNHFMKNSVSFFYNNSTHDELLKVLDYKRFKKVYLSIDKFSEINFIKLFELYNNYPDKIELDSCYKRILNNGTCNDIFVLNEDGNIYTCPYTTKFKDNGIKNESKECPFIKFKGNNENKF